MLRHYQLTPVDFLYNGQRGLTALQMLISEVHEKYERDFLTAGFTSYVICFSESPDLLSQWRGYADDGRGGCIGFSYEDIQRYCEESNGILQLKKVIYFNEEEIERIIFSESKRILDCVVDTRRNIPEILGKTVEEKLMSLMIHQTLLMALEKFFIASLQYKSAGFSEEQEWRMFLPMRAIKDPELINGSRRPSEELPLTKSIDFMRPRLRFNTTQDNISPYLEISLDEISESPVKEWWRGPKNRSALCDVELYLDNCGFKKVDIKRSRVSYI